MNKAAARSSPLRGVTARHKAKSIARRICWLGLLQQIGAVPAA